MKKIMAIVLASSMLVSLAGCSSSGSGSTATTAAAAETAAAADAGSASADAGSTDTSDRVLKIRKTQALISTNWEFIVNTEDMPVIWDQVFEGLYGLDEAGGGYCHDLAKDVSISDDGLVYTITLVDAVFQNGDPVTANDVVFSYNRAIESGRFNYATDMIDSVEAVDDSTVQFTLLYPYSAIDHTFYTVKISSEREVTELGDSYGTGPHTAGTGPYYVSAYDPAGNIVLKAHEDYWGGAPDIKTVEYVLITEDSAAVIAYENGEIDFMQNAPTTDWDSLVKASGENNAILKGNNIRSVYINYRSETNDGILANELVRKAICYAINKDAINNVVTNGLGVPTSEYIPSSYVETAPSADNFETYPYDPDKAIELLHEAGYTDEQLQAGVSVGTLTTYGAATGEKAKAAQVVQSNLEAVGLKCDIEVQDSSIISPRLHAFDYDLCIYGDSGNYDFNNIRQQVLVDGGYSVVDLSGDDSCVDYAKIQELLAAGIATTDISERAAIYLELWQMVADSATIYPYLHLPVAVVWSPAIDPGDGALSPTHYHIKTFSWK
ncbi:MAG: ABC transporter substrate-binding protein [Clostridiales bacterium]|nr:ABC transporter substrate-binding protein [Clostridiales bacterium]